MQQEKKGKKQRHQAILRLIEQKSINRQEELIEHLREEGFEVTQATISRDIRELNLMKISGPDGSYHYTVSYNKPKQEPDSRIMTRFETIFRESAIKVDYAGHIVLVKCDTGMANAACGLFDSLNWNNVVGTLSGDDTFFILTKTERDARTISSELARYVVHHL